jgi:hypothetical protein
MPKDPKDFREMSDTDLEVLLTNIYIFSRFLFHIHFQDSAGFWKASVLRFQQTLSRNRHRFDIFFIIILDSIKKFSAI